MLISLICYFYAMPVISQLFIYPIKSLGGIALNSALLTDRGLQYDRRWMLIDENNRFLSQRENARLALFKLQLNDKGITVIYTNDGSFILIPFTPETTQVVQVTIWDDTCIAQLVSAQADAWFSLKLGIKCRLVYMPDNSLRQTDIKYTAKGTITSFSDAYPILIIGQASLDDLNSRMAQPLPVNRFRPNMVFTGGMPYCEDRMKHLTVNGIDFYGVKLCARCVLTTIDQATISKGKEPLKTLAGYRSKNSKIYFGQNLVHTGTGLIAVGDELNILEYHTEERFIIPSKEAPASQTI